MYESDQIETIRLEEKTYPARYHYLGEYTSIPQLGTLFVTFDTGRPPFDDLKVRQAFAMAVDRERLAGELLDGLLYPASGGFVPPGMPGHSPGIALPYDPIQARQLLEQAGYPEGQGFPILELKSTQGQKRIIEYLITQWMLNLKIDVSLEISTFKEIIEKASSDNLVFLSWVAEFPDPDYFLRVFVHSNFGSHWNNQSYERLLDYARRTNSQTERIKSYKAAEKILIEDAAILPILYGRTHRLVKPWMKFAGGGFDIMSWKDIIIEPH